MNRNKKTPMYESITASNPAYDFVDFTTAETEKPALNETLARKIESIYKSQLLNIEESKEEDIPDVHAGPQHNQYPLAEPAHRQRVPFSPSTNHEPLSGLRNLKTLKSVQDNYQDEYLSYTNNSSLLYNRSQFSVAPNENRKYSYECDLEIGTKKSIPGWVSEFTSDELISIMPNPYKDNLELLKSRVKARKIR